MATPTAEPGVDRPSPREGLRLNLGSGPRCPEGWVNVDKSWGACLANHPHLERLLHAALPACLLPGPGWPPGLVSADLTRRLPWPDGSAVAVHSSHLIEHLTPREGLALLRECFRVLCPGGHVRVTTPDLAHLVEVYRHDQREEPGWAAEHFHANTCFFTVERPSTLRGFLTYRLRGRANHRFLYDRPALTALLAKAGFVDVQERACGESAIAGIEAVDQADRFAGATCLEARRPG